MDDLTQLKLTIVDGDTDAEDPRDGSKILGKDILKQMERNRVWREDADGKYSVIQYAGREYRFRPRKVITVPKNIGEALIRSSHILVGNLKDALTNPDVPYLRVVGEFVLGQEDAPEEKSPTVCEMCGEECKTLPRKARHYMKHKDDPKYAEFFGKSVDEDEPVGVDAV